MAIAIPKLALVLLVGPSGSGKSTFARRHFLPTEIVSSDTCRGIVCDDENAQEATEDAFALLHAIVRTRLKLGRLTVVDATNVQEGARRSLLEIAKEYHVQSVAIVFDLPERLCHERNASRPDRQFGPHVVRNQLRELRRSVFRLTKDFKYLYTFRSLQDVEDATIERTPLWTDGRGLHGPFDIVGDVHGCYVELTELLPKLGYQMGEDGNVTAPEGRTMIFLGDLIDRGPDPVGVLQLVMSMVSAGTALCVPGNHDVKLLRYLQGRKTSLTHGLQETVDALEAESQEFRDEVKEFLDRLVSHFVLDDGKLVVAHAGLKAEMQGRASGRVREFCLYGDTTGEIDEFGLPVRYPWAVDYRGRAMVVYGHTPVPVPEWLNNTIDIDTGCAFGGNLTALRYPERELVSVPAHAVYAESKRPFLVPSADDRVQHAVDDVLDLDDVTGKRLVETRLRGKVTIREENAAAALEIMSRFAANPKWLVYLPPTMSPAETATVEGYLEYPTQAFRYYLDQGVETVVCEEKHMGSRAVVVLCRDEAVAKRRFGVTGEGRGIVVTRTGRRFFEDRGREEELLAKLDDAMTASGTWDELETDWILLDAELMPWSAKAQELLRRQYAPVGAAAVAATSAAATALNSLPSDGGDLDALRDKINLRKGLSEAYVAAYGRYCWPVDSVEDLRLAPFHILATEKGVHTDRPHPWHMETLSRFCGSGVLFATPYRIVPLHDEEAVAAATAWWEERTNAGSEGMVIKPLDFITMSERGPVQPALKIRGREYLRIIYGPEYTLPENLDRLRKRGLSGKRSLAIREFALGIEGLERFIRQEPLRRVHECVFGVLALESEPVDPRL